MNIERDKFLTEAMGEKWWSQWEQTGDSEGCGYWVSKNDFSTPDGFFKLWKFCESNNWWVTVDHSDSIKGLRYSYGEIDLNLINPDRFADAVYTYLREAKK